MIRYILLIVAFQLLFLVIYDLFLKRETFFQWNRVYLIGSFILSLVLPFIRLEVLTTVVSQDFAAIVLPEIILTAENVQDSALVNVSWTQIIFIGGAVIAFSLFVFKIYQIIQLRRSGRIERFSDFIKVIVPKSTMAFSFYRTVFLGEDVSKQDEEGILQHELVHIKQKHTLDLLFFELMRVVCWFNPLVYVYQSKVSELHEFIADAQVSKSNRKAQYELLLSQIFQTKNISFINNFFKSSLIKKRIVMLQKSKSSQILKFKYLLLLPLVASMLFYTSCETEQDRVVEIEEVNEVEALEEVVITALAMDPNKINVPSDFEIIEVVEEAEKVPKKGLTGDEVAFSVLDEAPLFPECENAEDTKKCFKEKMNRHIRRYFKYPEKAMEKGIQGLVFMTFTIDKNGLVTNLRMRGPNSSLEKEAARIISKLPQMTPGKQGGKAVSVPFSIPINFKINK